MDQVMAKSTGEDASWTIVGRDDVDVKPDDQPHLPIRSACEGHPDAPQGVHAGYNWQSLENESDIEILEETSVPGQAELHAGVLDQNGHVEQLCATEASGDVETKQVLAQLTSLYPVDELPERYFDIVKGHIYRHTPNSKLDRLLTTALILGLVATLGLGLGHFLGWSSQVEVNKVLVDAQEEKFDELTDSLVSCMTGIEGQGGDDQDLDDRVILQLSAENKRLKDELHLLRQGGTSDPDTEEISYQLKDRINELLVMNADLEREVARLRYSQAAPDHQTLQDLHHQLEQTKLSLSRAQDENKRLKEEIGKACLDDIVRRMGLMSESLKHQSLDYVESVQGVWKDWFSQIQTQMSSVVEADLFQNLANQLYPVKKFFTEASFKNSPSEKDPHHDGSGSGERWDDGEADDDQFPSSCDEGQNHNWQWSRSKARQEARNHDKELDKKKKKDWLLGSQGDSSAESQGGSESRPTDWQWARCKARQQARLRDKPQGTTESKLPKAEQKLEDLKSSGWYLKNKDKGSRRKDKEKDKSERRKREERKAGHG